MTAPGPAAEPPVQRTPVLLNGKWLAQARTGTQRFADEISRRLLVDPRLDVMVGLPSDATMPTWLPTERVRRSRLRGVAFEQLALPALARGRVLVSLAGPAPLVVRRQVATFHDATPFRYPATYTRAFRAWHQLIYRVVSRRALAILTVSDFSARELAEVLDRPLGRFHMVSNGADHLDAIPPTPPDLGPGGVPNWFVLCVGTLAVHKNLAGVLDSLEKAALPTVVVGARGSARIFAGTADVGGDTSVIRYAAHLTDAQLVWLYQRAGVLVFPSRYEGFGLPIVEAQSLGCPVIVSQAAGLPDVAGPGAILIDPDRPDDVPAVVRRVLADPVWRAQVVAAGRRNADRFRWADSARLVGDVILATGGGSVR